MGIDGTWRRAGIAGARSSMLLALLQSCAPVIDPSAPAWQPVAASGPSPRWGQAAVYDARRDRMVVFGGQTPDGVLDEVWALDLASRTWSRLAPTGGGPAPRANPGMILDAPRDRVVVTHGRTGLVGMFGDTFALDLGTLAWSALATAGPAPPARQRPHFATDGESAWLYGGEAFLDTFGDLWRLDLASGTWSALPTDGDGPGARTCGAIAVEAGAGAGSPARGLWLTGGHDVAVLPGTFRYDLGASRWSRMAPRGSTSAGAHWAYALDAGCGRLYLSGGDHDDKYDTSLTDRLVIAGSAFEPVRTATLPAPRDHATLVVDTTRHALVLFGGGLDDGESYYGDALTLALSACGGGP